MWLQAEKRKRRHKYSQINCGRSDFGVYPRWSHNIAMEESISLEETNKIRISLGLKPLTEDSAPADDKEKQAEANYAKRRETEVKECDTKYVLVILYFIIKLIVPSSSSLDESRIALPSECHFSELPCRKLLALSLGFQGACAERSKVAFGFSSKRKAGEDASGTPPPKSARH
jgi:HIND motif protein